MAVVSELQVIIDGDSSRLLKSLAQSSAATKVFSSTMGTAAAGTGLALAGIGVAATAMALDYEESFTRISALSNASAEDVERWKGEVLDLAGETAQAPKELADALFFLSSAGLEAAEIMPALEVSAKAAAVGLGETEDIANIVASALNAYADAGLEAADVTDTLVAAVREGRAEPEEFANALGRILPIASQAGVSFDNVTASLAALSNIGLDVNEGVTAMRGALQAIVAPGSMAADALKQIGLTAQDMLDAIDERGLFGAIQMLDEAARRNTDTQAEYIGVLREVIPNVRSLTGVLGLTGQEAEKVQAIFDNVKDSTGDLQDAMDVLRDSAGFKLRKALREIQVVLIELGSEILPAVAWAAEQVSRALTPITAWWATSREVAEGLASIGESMGLTGDEAAKVESNIAGLSKGLDGFLGKFADPFRTNTTYVEEFTSAWLPLKVAMQQAGLTGEEIQRVFDDNVDVLTANRASIDDFVQGVRSSTEGTNRNTAAMLAAHDATKSHTNAVREDSDALRKNATEALAARSAHLELAGGVMGLIEAARTYSDAQDRVNRLEAAGREGTKAYEDAVTSLLGERMSLEQSMIELGTALAEEGKSVADAREELRAMGERAGLSRDALKDFINAGLKPVRDEVQGLTDDLNGIPKNVKSHVDVIVNARELYGLVSDIEGYAARHYMIGVEVDTYPGSPWPHEALDMYLIHPMQRMGFKRKADRWELPLDVTVHTDAEAAVVRNRPARRRSRADNLAFAVGHLPGLKDVHRTVRRGERMDIHLDRKRFAEELSYDSTYRGW